MCIRDRAQIKDDIDETGIDRQELLSWSIQTLMAAAGQAMQQKNPGAVVSAIRQLDHMTGTDITLTEAKAYAVDPEIYWMCFNSWSKQRSKSWPYCIACR